MELIFGVAAVGIAVLTLWYAISSSNRKVDADYVVGLERRIGKLEVELKSCQRDMQAKLAENIELMRQLVGVPAEGD